jgi:hypothetical protein
MSQEPHDPAHPDEPDHEAAEAAEAFASFVSLVSSVEPAPAPEHGRERLLAALHPEGRLDAFADAAARMLDITPEQARKLLDDAARPEAYEPGPFPDVHLQHITGGPAAAGAVTGFVRMPGGTAFPLHDHLGDETVLVLQGSLFEPETGRVARAGDVLRATAGDTHTTVARPGPDLVYLVVLFEGLRIGETEIRADDPRL